MTATVPLKRTKRRPMAEINVVPYIDVMLVLLVIFMVTAPLIYQGMDVDLPQTSAQPIQPEDNPPIIVTVNRDGETYIAMGAKPDEAADLEAIQVRIVAALEKSPQTPVMVRGDKNVAYGAVMDVMARLSAAGVEKVGMMTEQQQSQ